MARRAPKIEVAGRTEEPAFVPSKCLRGLGVVGVGCLLAMLAGGYGWYRAQRLPEVTPPVTLVRQVATPSLNETGAVTLVVGLQNTNRTAVVAGQQATVSTPGAVENPESSRSGAIRVKVAASEYMAAFLAETGKRLRVDTNVWQTVHSFPQLLVSVPCGPRQVHLEIEGFECSSLSGANNATANVAPDQTNEVEFVLSPRPANLKLSCNVSNAVVGFGNLKSAIANDRPIPSLRSLELMISAAGYRTQTMYVMPLPGVAVKRDVVLEREAGAIRVAVKVSENARESFTKTGKRMRVGTNAWEAVTEFPHEKRGMSCGALDVVLDAHGFDVSTQCVAVADTQTSDVIFELKLIEPGIEDRQKVKLGPPPLPAVAEPAVEEGKAMTVDLGGGVKLAFVWIPPGKFMMGSPESEKERLGSEGPRHRVTISKGFWMSKYEITQAQWQVLMGSNPSVFKGASNPVENISWNDCQTFIQKLNHVVTNCAFRMPTEAEWEYACRAGTSTRFNLGDSDDIPDLTSWHNGNSGDATHPVGQKAPNAWGLYDMHGNVWEWCQDRKGDYTSRMAIDPIGPSLGANRVLRGGAWNCYPRGCRSSYRDYNLPSIKSNSIGCRVVGMR